MPHTSKLPALFLLAALAAPMGAAPHPVPAQVTVDQLNQVLDSLQQKRDADAARTIAALELTDRPNAERLAHWKDEVQSRRASAALLAVVDGATFLSPPALDVPADPAPDAEAQAAILARAREYVNNTVPKLPNFSALRSSTDFELGTEDKLAGPQPQSQLLQSKQPKGAKVPREDLGLVKTVPSGHLYLDGVWAHTVTYRDGKEVAEAQPAAGSGQMESLMLSTTGEFGPILFVVMNDLSHGKVAWNRWERGAKSTLAVFGFEVPQGFAHYAVQAVMGGEIDLPAYRGEMAIDPATGAIYRITIQAWQHEPGAAEESGIAVEYGTVTIGGSAYICPVHGVAFFKIFTPYIDEDAQPAPWYESLNDVTFTQYHVFRAESRILPTNGPGA